MNHSAVINKIKNSIAFIATFDSDNRPLGTGSGFIFLKPGVVVTCYHVIKDTASIFLKFPDSESYVNGKVLIRDEEHDLALLKIDDDQHDPLILGDIDMVKEGIPVLFSGYPVGLMNLTTHQGIISAITKDETGITSFLIDGTVNSGNSGCPLMDEKGNVIGVVNAKRMVHSELIQKVVNMNFGALSLHGVDIVEIYQALINNVQLGIGYAVPASYIPEHKEIKESDSSKKKVNNNG